MPDADAVGDMPDIAVVAAPSYAEPGVVDVPHAVSRKVPNTADAASTRYRMRVSLAWSGSSDPAPSARDTRGPPRRFGRAEEVKNLVSFRRRR
jgi:hypothetical protein